METPIKVPAYMASSVDATQVSSRVTGIVVAGSSIIIFFAARFFHIQLEANDIVQLATEAGAVAGAIWTLKGIIIWLMTKFGKQSPTVVTPVVSVDPAIVTPPPAQTV